MLGKALLTGTVNQYVPSAALAHSMRTPGLMSWPVSSPSLSSGFPQGGAPETTAVSSCTFSFNLSQALKLQLPGICYLWLLQREGLFEKQIPRLWTILHNVKEAMKPM